MTNALANLNTITPNVAPLALFIARHGGEVDLDCYTNHMDRGSQARELVVKLSLPVPFTGARAEIQVEGKGETPTEAILHAIKMGKAGCFRNFVHVVAYPFRAGSEGLPTINIQLERTNHEGREARHRRPQAVEGHEKQNRTLKRCERR